MLVAFGLIGRVNEVSLYLSMYCQNMFISTPIFID